MNKYADTVYTSHMNIRELLSESSIEIGAELFSKDEALDKLVSLQNIQDKTALREEIREREEKGNTAVAGRIAIPDVVHRGSNKTSVSALTLKSGVDYVAPDKRKVTLIFMISGKSGTNEHAAAKARLLRLLMDSAFTAQLCSAQSKEEFLRLIEERERLRFTPAQPDRHFDCSKFLFENNKKLRSRKRRFFRFKNA